MIIIIIIAIIIVVAIIRGIYNWLEDHFSVILIVFGVIAAIVGLIYCILNNPMILLYIAIGIGGLGVLVLLGFLIIFLASHIKKRRKKKGDDVYLKVYSFVENQYSERQNKLLFSLEAIIAECFKNSQIKKAIKKLYGDSRVNCKHSDREIICWCVAQIEINNIYQFLIKKIQQVGAYTKSEAVEYCLKEMKFIALSASSISSEVSKRISLLVAKNKLSRKPIGTDDVLYANNTGSGEKLKIKYIELS